MAKVRCEIIDDIPEEGAPSKTVAIQSAQGRREFVQVPAPFLNGPVGAGEERYLSVSVVRVDSGRQVVLVELPYEADSGARRMWVPLASLSPQEEVTT